MELNLGCTEGTECRSCVLTIVWRVGHDANTNCPAAASTVASNFPALASSPTLKTQSAEDPALNTPPAEEASTHAILDQDDYEPYNISDFVAPNELLPFTSTPAAANTSTSSLTTNYVPALVSESYATHKDLGSGLPQGLQAFRSTPRFSSSRHLVQDSTCSSNQGTTLGTGNKPLINFHSFSWFTITSLSTSLGLIHTTS